ncbi:S26 family signal peptidase, partial [Caldisericum sp.]|uniref:S26 family signal peptidase n=1 Tax=Caldisericum sp. TaxID=2499687 RepID=UPI003D0AAE0F
MSESKINKIIQFRRICVSFIVPFIVIAASFSFIVRHFYQPFCLRVSSAFPNIKDHTCAIVDLVSYHFRNPHMGELVIYYNNQNEYMFSRVASSS